jgi:archaellum biogenesis ATPase FlaH
MPDKPSTFRNQLAEAAVLATIIKHRQFFPAFEKLSVADFTQTTFGNVFAKMRELHAAGIQINEASVGWGESEEQIYKYGEDWEEGFDSLVAVIKECALRDEIVRKLGLDFERAEEMSTPTLVLKAREKTKEIEETAKPFKDAVEKYTPSLNQKVVEWDALETETDILDQQGETLDYVVNEIIPRRRVTMLFGQEKSGKSIVSWDLCKHIANGKAWLNRKTVKTPCLYLDLEDGILGQYIGWTVGVGPEKVRFITVRSKGGIPALDDPTLLALCLEKQPVIVLDSLHKLFTREKDRKGASAWNAGDYEPVLEKIRHLCVAGATVILIHHSTKADGEQYRDSSAIGANVDFLFAVVGDTPESGVKRVHLIGKPSRGAQPPTVHILAFPHIIEQGHLCADAGLEKEDVAAFNAADEVRNNGPAKSRNDLFKRLGGKRGNAMAAIAKAISFGYLFESADGTIDSGDMPLCAPVGAENRWVPTRVPVVSELSGTDEGTGMSESL